MHSRDIDWDERPPESAQPGHNVGSGRRRREALSGQGRRRSHQGVPVMKDSARYAKVVEWSEEDQCYVGSAPGLIYGGCHGDDEQAVFSQLCQIVEEAVELYRRDDKPLPPSTAGQ